MSESQWSSASSLTTKSNYIPSAEQAILTASDKTAGNNFGWSVAISGDGSRVVIGSVYAAVGAYTQAGVAYIYIRSGTTWTQEAKLTASLNGTGNSFSYSVDINGDGSRVICGVPFYDQIGADTGRCFIFSRSGTTWTQEAILDANDATSSASFGYSVAITTDASRCVIGAYTASPSGITSAGKVYIFIRSGTTWSQEAMLTASDKAASDYFGSSVDIDSTGTRIISSSPFADPQGAQSSGKAYIFVRSGTTWSQEAVLGIGIAISNANFGYSVAMSSDGSRCIVGAWHASYGSFNYCGRALIFIRSGSTWTEECTIMASDIAGSTAFGTSVSINSNGSIVGIGAASATIGTFSGAGAAYIFSRSGSTWSQSAKVNASNRQTNDYFGNSIAIDNSGTFLLVGNPYSDPGSVANAGAAYIFS